MQNDSLFLFCSLFLVPSFARARQAPLRSQNKIPAYQRSVCAAEVDSVVFC
jgi:hypothetical protein